MNASIRVENILAAIFVLYLLVNIADWLQTTFSLDPHTAHPCIVRHNDGRYTEEMRSHERDEVQVSQPSVANASGTAQP